MKVTDLSAGMRSILARFEAAARDHAFKGALPADEWPEVDAQFDRAKQQMVRKLLRMEGKLPPDGRGRKKGITNYNERKP